MNHLVEILILKLIYLIMQQKKSLVKKEIITQKLLKLKRN